MWTIFCDTHSHGFPKQQWERIHIEADEDLAREIFFKSFGQCPDERSCNCCGPDYRIEEFECSLEEATAVFWRHCLWDDDLQRDVMIPGKEGKYISIEDYMKNSKFLFISSSQIRAAEAAAGWYIG